MTEVILKVGPATGGGWWMNCDLPLEPTFFQSGADAEHTARALALRLADNGCDVSLQVSDLSERPIATHRFFAP